MSRTFHIAACLLIAITLTPLSAASQTAERSRTEGLKETERFVKAGGTTSQAVAAAKLQVSKTLDSYNALVTQPSKNMKSDYKKLMSSMDTMNTKAAEAGKTVATMQATGDTCLSGTRGDDQGITRSGSSEPGAGPADGQSEGTRGSPRRAARIGQALEPFPRNWPTKSRTLAAI